VSKEQSIVAYEDAKTKTIRYRVNGVDITSSIELLKEQFLNQWNKEHKITTELTFYERNKILDLEAKLAEKDELIGTLKNKYECADRELYLTKDTLKHHTNIYNLLVESRHQDKISFAVEQLTEIRDYVKNCWSLDTTEGKVRLDISKKIRLKIEALTHQHEDKGE
jgi:hypothetical protein